MSYGSSQLSVASGGIAVAQLAAAVAAALCPAGVVLPYGGTSAPTGWLLCDGSAVSRSTYATLFSAIGVAFGSGNGTTTFNVPDTRGRFIRGLQGAASAGASNGREDATDVAARVASASGGNTGNNVGSLQYNDAKAHTHTWNMGTGYGATAGSFFATGLGQGDAGSVGTVTTTSSGGSGLTGASGAESRPANLAFNHIIKT